jgi:hypothetical protein
MRAFVISCAAAIILAVGGYAVLNVMQKPVDIAYATSSVRI